ncbi:Lcl domain-containing protein [Hydrogenimonas sp.]
MKHGILRTLALILLITGGTALIVGSGNGDGTVEEGNATLQIVKTGQSVVYREYDDGYYQWGLERNFTRDDTLEIVTDHVRGLMWQDDADVEYHPITGNYDISEKTRDYCSRLRLGGYSDWRVPRRDELLSIADFGHLRSIDPIFRHLSETGDYWATSEASTDGWYAKAMHIDFSALTSTPTYSFPLYLRCVRGERTKIDRFARNDENEVVTDSATQLMWTDDTKRARLRLDWYEAVDYCADLTYAGYSDWRLPNMMELFSLVDTRKERYGRFAEIFESYPTSLWSSTTNVSDSRRAYALDQLVSGSIFYYRDKGGTWRKSNGVFCVRDGITTVRNTPPVAVGQRISLAKNSVKRIVLSGSDPENDPLTYIVTADPLHGTLSGTAPDLNYTPETDYTGSDSFSFKVNDGVFDSKEANITLTIYDPAIGGVLKTGQTTQYLPYDDGYYQKGESREFLRNDALQIVEDRTGGRMWQDDSDAATRIVTIKEAESYCSGLTLGGYDDWRVPGVEELMMLTDKGRFDPAIDPAFKNVASGVLYMTSTRDRTVYDDSADGLFRWGVGTLWGYDARGVSKANIRCVRGNTFIHGTFVRNDLQNVVTDTTTRLMWQDDKSLLTVGPMEWSEAIAYCESLTLGGYGDWRVPNFNELYSIWDRSLPSWDTGQTAFDAAFKYVANGVYWTSTTPLNESSFAYVQIGNGLTSGEGAVKSNGSDIAVRCVRDAL